MKHTVTPVVFVHGLWLHASSWDNWLKLFRRLGYEPIAPGWPGEPHNVYEARLLPEDVAGVGIDTVTKYYADVISELGTKPIVIGHSFGGLVVQKLVTDGVAAAGVAIAPAQPRGVRRLPLRQLVSALPALKNPFNCNGTVALTAQQFRYGFGNALSLEESTELYTQWSIPSPAKPLFSAATANLFPHSATKTDTANTERGPMLLIAGGRDNTVPASVVRSIHRLYTKSSSAITDIQEFSDRGHSMPIDSGWREVADASIAWLKERVHAIPPEA